MRNRGRRILVAGLGNLLLADDGVGVHAVRELSSKVPRGVLAVEIGTAVLDALPFIERATRLLAIDAMQAGGAPGTLYSFGVEDVERRQAQASLHELTLLEALQFARRRPTEIVILGVEPGRIGYEMALSPPVEAAMPQLIAAALEVVGGWLGERPGPRASI